MAGKLEKRDSIYFSESLPLFSKYPSSKKIFTKNGEPYNVGDLFIQDDLARTLEQIKENGRDGFYKGKTAELLVEQVGSLGGYITPEDLKNISPLKENRSLELIVVMKLSQCRLLVQVELHLLNC